MKTAQKFKFSAGFTLVELLVAISIIGLLSTLIFANFAATRVRGRDVQRKSDLREVQKALRLYYNDKGIYPTHNTTNFTINGCGSDSTSECSWGSPWSAGTQTYMNALPKDPASNRSYRYERSNLDDYTLKACLENRSDTSCSSVQEGWCNTTLAGCIYQLKP